MIINNEIRLFGKILLNVILIFLVLDLGILYIMKLIIDLSGLQLTKLQLGAIPTFLGIITAAFYALYIFEKTKTEYYKREEEKQIDLLRTFLEELTFLRGNLIAFKKTFSRPNVYPFYGLWEIDAAPYLMGLGHKLQNKETVDLKKNLMVIKDKLLVLNNMKLESKKDQEERGEEKRIQIKVESIREGIVKIIDDDFLPIIEKSKKLIQDRWNL